MQFAQLLSPEDVEKIHEASCEILENVGMIVHSDNARRIYAEHGCRLEGDEGLVKFPRSVVDEYRSQFVPTFTFKGRDPEKDRTLPNDRPVVVTASSAPNVIDPGTGRERRANSR